MDSLKSNWTPVKHNKMNRNISMHFSGIYFFFSLSGLALNIILQYIQLDARSQEHENEINFKQTILTGILGKDFKLHNIYNKTEVSRSIMTIHPIYKILISSKKHQNVLWQTFGKERSSSILFCGLEVYWMLIKENLMVDRRIAFFQSSCYHFWSIKNI